MAWIALLLLFALSATSYVLARRRVTAMPRQGRLHSLPGYHGAYAALMAGVPAALLLIAALLFGPRIQHSLVSADPPAAVRALPSEQAEMFYQDAAALADRKAIRGTWEGDAKVALDRTAARDREVGQTFAFATYGLTAILAVLGALLAMRRLTPQFRARNRVEGWIGALLIACSAAAILTTLGIVLSLVWEALRFFESVSPLDFLFGIKWDPQIAMRSDQVAAEGAFGALPLFAGTFLVMMIAMAVAAPIGLFSAIYLSEYAGRATRSVVKPLLEILAGVPTVVYGFFAALTVGPLFRAFFNWLGTLVGGGLGEYLMTVQNQMALTAGVVMGIMLIPFVSSLSDDIINAVPQAMRDGSYAMGATRSETIKQVVLPAALPGIAGAILLAISRAVGETMIVTMAAGLQAKLTANPLETVTTVTVQIVTLLTGDQEFDSPKTLSAFGLGLALFVVTLALNVVALRIVQKYREQYD
jgi:phosphate transport system permease protein